MNRIVFPLKLQMKRAQVSDLHEALLLIGLQIADVEKNNMRFGTSTREAVRTFQSDNALPVTGVVDEATAAALNRLCAARGVLSPEIIYRVKGIVSWSDGKPAGGVTVQVFDRDVSRAQLLASAVTDTTGAYRIAFSEEKFKQSDAEQGGPELFIRVVDDAGQQLFQSKTIMNAPLEVILDAVIPSVPANLFSVRGRVTTSEGTPAFNANVKAFDRNPGEDDIFLGEAATDAQGNYAIAYALEKLAGKPAADLVVILYQGGRLMQTADVIFDAQQETTQDFIIPVTPVSEFDRLIAQVKPLLRGELCIGKLDAQQIAFLKQKIKVAANKLEYLNEAHKLANEDRPLEEFYYVLLSDDLPTAPEEILKRSRASIVRAVKRATASNLISQTVETQLDRILDEELPKQRGLNLLNPSVPGQPASLGDLLDTLPEAEKLENEARLAFAINFGKHGTDGPLWETQGASIYASSIPALKRTLALNDLAQGHKPLVAALQDFRNIDEPESITFLAGFSLLDWLDLTLTHGVPPNNQITQAEFAIQLESTIEQRFPTDVFRERLASGNVRIKDFPTQEVLKLLSDHKDFNLGRERADDFLERIGAKTPELSDALRKVQRVLPLAGDLRTSAALLNAGFDSAFSIARAGVGAMTARMDGELTDAQVKAIHSVALDSMATSQAIVARYSPRFNPHSIEAIPYSKPSAAFLAKYPNLRNLFGDIDYCACNHCESVLGPSAYLADLLHFLETSGPALKSGSISTSWPFLALHKRRPDIANLLLSCDNTNTEIPYIDLVLEVLENQVALPHWFKVTGQDSEMIATSIDRGELSVYIRDVLEKTAVTIGDRPEVAKIDNLPAELVRTGIRTMPEMPMLHLVPNDSYIPFKITDGAREWIVAFVPKGLWLVPVAQAPKLSEMGNATVDVFESSLSKGKLPAKFLSEVTNRWIPCSTTVKLLGSSDESDDNPRFTAYEASISLGFDIVAVQSEKGLVVSFLRPSDGKVVRKKMIKGLKPKVHITAWLDGKLPERFDSLVLDSLDIPEHPWKITHPEPGRCALRYEIPKLTLAISDASLGVLSLTYRSSSVTTDLAAVPENRNPAAYTVLGKAVYPWALPFDLPATEIRAYLSELGVPRQKLMEIAGKDEESDGYAREVLGFTLADKEPSMAEPWVVWDLKKNGNLVRNSIGEVIVGSWTEVLRDVSIILDRSGLTFRELLDIRQTGLGIVSWSNITPAGECHPSKMAWTEIDEPQLAWIHAFNGLSRKTGWSMREVNCCLSTIKQHPKESFVDPRRLSVVARLRSRFNRPLMHVAAMLGYMETKPWVDHTMAGEPVAASLYDSVFQRSALRASESYPLFRVDVDSGELAYLAPANLAPDPDKISLNVHSHFLAASLGITPNEVELLIACLPETNEMTVSNLTRLFGALLYCRSLRLSIEEFIRWMVLLGNPFGATDFEGRATALLQFADDVEFAKDSNTSLDELDFLLRHDLRGEFADIETRMLKALSSIRNELQKGTVLGDASVENVVIQLRKLGASERLLSAISEEVVLQKVLYAEMPLDSDSNPLPELPTELGNRFYYRNVRNSVGNSTMWLGCRGIIEEHEFSLLPDSLMIMGKAASSALKYRYQFIREAFVSQANRIVYVAGDFSNPLIPKLEIPLEAGSTVYLPDDLQSIFSFTDVQGVRTLMVAGVLSPEQCAKIESILPGLTQADLAALSDRIAATVRSSERLIEPSKVDDLLTRRSATEIRNALLNLVPVLEIDLLASQLSGLLELDLQVARYLLTNLRNKSTALELFTDQAFLMTDASLELDSKTFHEQLQGILLLYKAVRWLRGRTITVRQLEWMNGDLFDVPALHELPTDNASTCQFSRWRAFQELMQFIGTVEGGVSTVQSLVNLLVKDGIDVTSVYKLAAPILKEAYALEQGQVEEACDVLNVKTMQDFSKPGQLLRLIRLIHLLKLLGTSVEVVQRLTDDAPDANDSMLARKLFMARFDSETLPKRLQPISDRLRTRQRDALVSYLKWRDRLPDDNTLLDYYLIDVKMEPCMRTSRIKQAISSVQLFIQRCLLNLEKDAPIPVEPGDIDLKQWAWMKNYRVWEANRKVFLYPENWIEPDLRDDKSEIFRGLETELQKENLDFQAGIDVYRGYLERAADISGLRVIAMWRELLSGNLVDQILAREASSQSRLYHRELTFTDDSLCWTPWESIDGSIDSEHVFIFKLAGFLHIAFAEISQDMPYWKVSFSVRRKTKKGWSAPYKLSEKDALRLPVIPGKNPANTFVFTLNTLNKEDGEYVEISAHTIDYEGSYIAVPGDGKLNITIPYNSGVAQRLHAYIRVLEKFSDQYGYTVYAKPGAREWKCKIDISILISIAPLGQQIFEIHTLQINVDEFSASDSCSLLEYFGLNHLASLIRIHKIIVTALGDPGVHEEHAVSLEVDINDMGAGSYERDIVFTIKKELHHPAFAPDRQVNYHQVDKKFVINEHLSISAVTCNSSLPDALPSLPDDNSERYRSGFRQLWPIAEAQAEAARARAVADAATSASTKASEAADSALAIAAAASARAIAAESYRMITEARAEELEQKAKDAAAAAATAAAIAAAIPPGTGVHEAALLAASVKATEAAAVGIAAIAARKEAATATAAADEAQRVAKQSAATAEVPAGKAAQLAGEAAWLEAEAKAKEEKAAAALAFPSVGEYLSHSNGRYFRPSTQPMPRTWTVSDAYCDDRFQLYFLWHSGKQRILAEGQAWLYAGIRQLPTLTEQGGDLPLLPISFQGSDDGQSNPSPDDPLALPLGPLGKDSPKDVRVNFSSQQPSSTYDWEAVFHVPLLIATHLSSAQRFEDAQRWFHTIFDPTTNANGQEALRYWRFPPFKKAGQGEGIDHVLELLATDEQQTEEQQQNLIALRAEIAAWKQAPFNPHLIARSRIRAYQWTVVIKYIDNLIAWGDQLFRRDTIESINEATQLYVLAARILGQRPASVPRCKTATKSYFELAHLLTNGLDEFSNAFVALEDARVSGDFGSLPMTYVPDVVNGLYFCIPPNSEIGDLWQKVDERLFNIRHCRNIEGIERKLPLFEPPIDPALLVRAVAAGLDISAVLSDLSAPLSLYRFNVMLQKAVEVCGELRSLGNALQSALEKHDAEALSLLHSSHEIELLNLTVKIKEQQIKEAELAFDGLKESRKTVEVRYQFYQLLLGHNEITVPQPGSSMTLESVPLSLAKSGLDSDQASLGISQAEAEQLGLLREGQQTALASGIASTTSGVMFAIGGMLSAMPRGSSPGPMLGDMGGPLTGAGHAANALAGYLNAYSGYVTSQAGMKGIIAGYERRRTDWIFQSNMALRELQQIDKQIAAAEIRIAIARQDLVNVQVQVENSREVDEFMRTKFTNRELYRWMCGQLSSLYFTTYRLAHELAKRAERCFQFELGDEGTSYIRFGYWDSLKKGLLAGEQLHQDLKRLDIAYIERNKREYEITRHISLLQLNPEALIALRESHSCEFTIPEWLFDMDCPGHFMRRIKTVSLSIPCVTGSYTGVHCTLTLLSSVVRTSKSHEDYGEPSSEDPQRFRFDYSLVQSIVTSSGQSDSGMFETNLRDERYLPFEGAGAVGTWRLELPASWPQFDYATISDVILHIRYTAREGGGLLRNGAISHLNELIQAGQSVGLTRLFSVRHDFPAEWARFTAQKTSADNCYELKLNLRREHYPFWSQSFNKRVISVDILAASKADPIPDSITVAGKTDSSGDSDSLTRDISLGGLLVGRFQNIDLPAPEGDFSLFFDNNFLSDLWIVLSSCAAG